MKIIYKIKKKLKNQKQQKDNKKQKKELKMINNKLIRMKFNQHK